MGGGQTLLSVLHKSPITLNAGNEPSVSSHHYPPAAAPRPGRRRRSQSCSPEVQGGHPSSDLCSISSAQPRDNQSPPPERLPKSTEAAVVADGEQEPWGTVCAVDVATTLPGAHQQPPGAGVRVTQ